MIVILTDQRGGESHSSSTLLSFPTGDGRIHRSLFIICLRGHAESASPKCQKAALVLLGCPINQRTSANTRPSTDFSHEYPHLPSPRPTLSPLHPLHTPSRPPQDPLPALLQLHGA